MWVLSEYAGGRCGLWYNRESLPEFAYLFFWLAWSAPVPQTVMACTRCMTWPASGQWKSAGVGCRGKSAGQEVGQDREGQWNGSLGIQFREFGCD